MMRISYFLPNQLLVLPKLLFCLFYPPYILPGLIFVPFQFQSKLQIFIFSLCVLMNLKILFVRFFFLVVWFDVCLFSLGIWPADGITFLK